MYLEHIYFPLLSPKSLPMQQGNDNRRNGYRELNVSTRNDLSYFLHVIAFSLKLVTLSIIFHLHHICVFTQNMHIFPLFTVSTQKVT